MVDFVIKNHDGFEANEANEADIDINKEKEIKKEIEKEKNKTNSPVACLGEKAQQGCKIFGTYAPIGAKCVV